MPLWLDMSPTVVNRTAIYHIARDTAGHLAPMVAGYRFGTDVRAHFDLTRPEEQTIRQDVLGKIEALGAPRSTKERARRLMGVPARPQRRPRPRMLLFDPLYVLFEPIDNRDIVFVLDLTTLSHPEWHAPHIAALYARAFDRLLDSGAHIVSISTHTTASLRANFGLCSQNIVTVPLYARETLLASAPVKPQAVLDEPFVLFVGSLELRKNVVGLIQAFDISGVADQGLHLVIAGGEANDGPRVREAARAARNVHVLGFVSDGELRWLYENALAFAYPSYLEGFGVPIIEALKFGLPTLGAITGAVPEVAGPLAILVDPYDLQSIADGLTTLVENATQDTEKQRAARRSRAREYSLPNYLRVLSSTLEGSE